MTNNEEIYHHEKELWHYTKKIGLKGIITTQRLWATHYACANDKSEIVYLRSALRLHLLPHVREQLSHIHENGKNTKNKLENNIAKESYTRWASDFITNSLYNSTFGRRTDRAFPIVDPYISCFCSHTLHDQYVQQNGLLSMWRAYGPDGGYAIVFDTEKLWHLLKREAKIYKQDPGGFFGYVIYDKDSNFESAFEDLFDILPEFVRASAEMNEDVINKIFLPFIRASCFLKHRGFEEEKEVRIVYFPMTVEREEYCRSWDKNYERDNRMFKKIHHDLGKNKQCPHIDLFDFEKSVELPIKRIIVGPHKDQDRRKSWVQHLLSGGDIDVHISKTPYVG